MTPIIYENLTSEEIDFLVTNDCGSYLIDVPDFIFDEACWKHDINYFIGYTKEDRKMFDIQFYCDLKDLINELPWHERWKPAKWYAPIPMWTLPRIYYYGVRIGGWIGFNWKCKYYYEDLIYAMSITDSIP